jgi:6-phosphogluconolactonase
MPSQRLYAGSYTNPVPHAPNAEGRGVHVLDFDPDKGSLEHCRLAVAVEQPSFVLADPRRGLVFASSEVGEGRLGAYRARSDGDLDQVWEAPTLGSFPAHLSLAGEVLHVLAAHYGGKPPVVAFRVGDDGSLTGSVVAAPHSGHGPRADRQDGPHAHCVRPSPDGQHAYVCDLGTDEIVIYDLTPQHLLGRLGSLSLPPGSGPRHISFTPGGGFAFVTLELTSQVAVLGRTTVSGELRLLSVLPSQGAEHQGTNTPAEVLVSQDGRFVYVSNRGEDTIAVYAFDPVAGSLAEVQRVPTGGRTPRGCALTPNGRHLLAANQDSSSITVFSRDEQGGLLGMIGTYACPTPTSLAFLA